MSVTAKDAAAPVSIDAAALRRTLGHYPTGVCVITSRGEDGRPLGMIVGSFTSVSLDPPLVGFLPSVSARSWPPIERAGRFCVNVLAHDQQHLCRRFTGPEADRFTGVTHSTSAAGLPLLDGVVAWIDCVLHGIHEAGDHLFVLGRVTALESLSERRPLIFFQGGYGLFSSLEADESAT